jgi:3-sulfinopropanoyl-CoA desulfinase
LDHRGGVSRLHLVFARMFHGGKEQGIAGFVVVRDAENNTPAGLVIGRREPAMGVRGIPETEIILKDLEVPEHMVVIPPQGVRKGFAGLMNAYNAQRIGAATVAQGIAESAYELALDYARNRRQFGRPIAEFQGIQWMLADMSIQLAAARALIYKATRPTVPLAGVILTGHGLRACSEEVRPLCASGGHFDAPLPGN